MIYHERLFEMKTSPKNRIYSTVSVEEALKVNQETFIQIDGIDLSIKVLSLEKKSVSEDDKKELMKVYYKYLRQGKDTGFATPYLEIQLKEIKDVLSSFFNHSSNIKVLL